MYNVYVKIKNLIDLFHPYVNHIELALSAVDREFEPCPGQSKDYKIGICYFSTRHVALRSKNKEIRIMCASGATYLPEDCCVSELSL
jgi:hypothetical protein